MTTHTELSNNPNIKKKKKKQKTCLEYFSNTHTLFKQILHISRKHSNEA